MSKRQRSPHSFTADELPTVNPHVVASPSRVRAMVAGENEDEASPEFLNRELTWLEFNRRVLHEALDERTPLLERLGFLAIFNSNLDEFFMKRVGGLKQQIDVGAITRTPDGLTPKEQLRAIREVVEPMLRQQADCFRDLKPALAEKGVHLLEWDGMTDAERSWCGRYFMRSLFPVLTPLAVDPGHPFPFISNLSISLGVLVRTPNGEETHFARVKVPDVLPRWVHLPQESEDASDAERGRGVGGGADLGSPPYRFVRLRDIVRHHLHELFVGMDILEIEPFRVTRNAAVERDEEDAEDLLELVEQELRDRRFARVVRLETDDDPCLPINQLLIEKVDLHPHDVYEMPGELDYIPLWRVHALPLERLKYEPWTPIVPHRLLHSDGDIFSVIRAGDLLVHHPYESFAGSVERFVRAAARDPKVVAIKLTLYRTTADSPFLSDLIKAAESGKQVVALIELKARFDEERNVQLARDLEKAGVHVVYGVVGLKTHTKTTLVVRQESDGMRAYCHIGTGNYNAKTATLYTDLGLFTCDERITSDLVQLFHVLTGRSIKEDFDALLVAPINMRRRFAQMIDREISHCHAWRERGADPEDPDRPRIIAKMNSLEDIKMVRKLYDASRAGVSIDLIVRGFCSLRPGVEGMSENIRVISVIGRFLEHSRIYCFHNAGEREYYIGSADWMYRNLNNRVECIAPIWNPPLQARLQQVLDIMLADQRQAWDMHADGSYSQRQPDKDAAGSAAVGTHEALMRLTRDGAA